MRDQILTGIRNAINSTGPYTNPHLSDLTLAETEALADHILAALTVVPEDAPAPTLTVTPAATPTLMISPAEVVAMVATDAYREVTSDSAALDAFRVAEEAWAAGEDRREYREFLFAAQRMFGVRVRSVTDDGGAVFLVAGNPTQIRAFQRVVTLIHNLAQPVVADLPASERKEFWATLGHLVTSTERAQNLIADNDEAYAEATEYLNTEHGRSRNLARTAPVASGAVYEQALAVMARSEQSDPA